MKPGHFAELFCEARAVPVTALTFSGMVDYQDYKKAYAFRSLLGGLDAQYMMLRWLGMYAGYEYQQSGNVGSQVPQIGVAVVPISDRTIFRIGMESTISGQAYLNRVSALLWFVF